MMRSLFSGVAGLRNHQTRMDVIGNNIANVNTIGFKGSLVNFQDVLSQTMQGASSPQGSRGGTNPMQIGLGMSVASIDTVFTDGSFQPTGKQTDLSIKGQGFFILSDGANKVYTRAGNFDFDTKGNYLVPGTGYKVMGWMADATGKIDTNADLTNIQIPVGAPMPAEATSKVALGHNLDANAKEGTTVPASTIVYDSLGNSHKVNFNFYKEVVKNGKGLNTWLVGTSVEGITGVNKGLKEVTFDSNGQVVSVTDAKFNGIVTDVKLDNLVLDNSKGSNCTFTSSVCDESLGKHDLTFTFTGQGNNVFDYKIMEGNTVISSGSTTINAGPPLVMPDISGVKVGSSSLTLKFNNVNYTGASAPSLTAGAINKLDKLVLDNSVGSTFTFNNTVQDDKGNSHNLQYTFTGKGNGNFDYKIVDTSGTPNETFNGSMSITGNPLTATIPDITLANGNKIQFSLTDPAFALSVSAPAVKQDTSTLPDGNQSPISFQATGANQSVINLDLNKLTQFGQESTAQVVDKDGYTAGTLDFTTMSASGVLVGNFTNGQHRDLAQVALANFNNPGGLNKIGDSLYAESNNSGVPQTGTAGSGGRGEFNPGTLEMSNVDLAQEFSNMIITQRGFQANSKIITVSDEMLQDLANLKR